MRSLDQVNMGWVAHTPMPCSKSPKTLSYDTVVVGIHVITIMYLFCDTSRTTEEDALSRDLRRERAQSIAQRLLWNVGRSLSL